MNNINSRQLIATSGRATTAFVSYLRLEWPSGRVARTELWQ